jgi:hypothetical protein
MTESVHSFAVLAHGESPFLDECLRSLKDQTVSSEIFLATSTPSPYLSDAAARHGLEIKVNPMQGGIAADWTFAYQQCRTQYLTLAHQDDLYHPEYLDGCLSLAGRCPDNLITFTDYCEMVDGRMIPISCNLGIKKLILTTSYGIVRCLHAGFRKRSLLSWGCVIPCPSVMFHKQTIGDFSFSPEFSINLDWDAWARLAQRPGGFCYVPRRLMTHRLHGAAATTRGIISGNRQREDLAMFRRFWPGSVAAVLAAAYQLSLRRRKRNHDSGAGW